MYLLAWTCTLAVVNLIGYIQHVSCAILSRVAKIMPLFKPAPVITSGEDDEEDVSKELNEEDVNVQLSESWHGKLTHTLL